MSSQVLFRLEQRAKAAEDLLSFLRSTLSLHKQSSQYSSSSSSNKEYLALTSENSKLRDEIEEWKNKLVMMGGSDSGETKEDGKFDERESETQKEKTKNETLVFNHSVDDCIKGEPEQKKKEKRSCHKKQDSKVKSLSCENKESGSDDEVHIGRLDLRVGRILSAHKHPDADALYVETIDVGEAKPRTVISGLVKFIPEAEMQNRMVVLLCNLKPSKMRGILSEAMVMCASTPEKVEILEPPGGAKPGDIVQVPGYESKPDALLNPKKKIFETLAPDLRVNSLRVATYKDIEWRINGQVVMSSTLSNVNIK